MEHSNKVVMKSLGEQVGNLRQLLLFGWEQKVEEW